MLLAVRISSYECTWKVWRALKKLEHLSCSPNFPRASITRYTHAKHEQILKYKCERNSALQGAENICENTNKIDIRIIERTRSLKTPS